MKNSNEATPGPLPVVGDIWYRYEDVLYAAPLDEFDYPTGSPRLAVELRTFQVKKVTPKGVWVGRWSSTIPYLFEGEKHRFVLFDARKQFACPSKLKALESFVARKERQSGILSSQLRRADQSVAIGKQMIDKESQSIQQIEVGVV